jgi:soluble lytic murein transglycosylase
MTRHTLTSACLCLALLTPSVAEAKPLSLKRFAPYLRGRLAAAGQALGARDYGAAARLLERQLKRRPRHRRQLTFLLAYARYHAKDYARAAPAFAGLVGRYPLLADYCRSYAARAYYKLKRFSDAERLARAVRPKSVLAVESSLVRADALRALRREQQALPLWRRYLRLRPGGGRVAEGHLRLAQGALRRARSAKTPAAKLAARHAAVRHFKAILIQRPLARQAAAAAKGLKSAARGLPKAAARLSGKELLRQARVLYRKQRNRRAERGFLAAIARGDLDDAGRCRARYYVAKSIFKQRQRDRAEPHFARAVKLCRKAKRRQLVVKSLYNQARGLYRKGKYLAAAKLFLALEREFPQHSYGDDARLRAAEAYAELKNKAEVKKLLAALPALHPRGDQRREALWRLARRAYFDRRYDAAQKHLTTIIDTLGHARRYYAEGRALYWRGRIHQKRRKRGEALKAFEAAIREYPLSYYALQAFNRLRESWPKRFRRARRELLTPIGKKAGRWSFDDGGLSTKPSFRRGVELLRLGLGRHAARELARAGLSTRNGPKPRLWLAAVLFDRAGQWAFSHQVPRSRDWRWKRDYPLRDNVRRWRIAYPRAFPQLVGPLSRRAAVPRQLSWAVMREESGFSTRIESYANAIGLMQLILPTARAAGSRHRMRVNRRALRNPATNIKLGTTFLSFLKRTFRGVTPLMIAGYNAGHGAVYRWLARYRRHTLDELMERIPYDQTRRYSKRVLASYFAYTVLWSKQRDVPRIGLKLPKARREAFGRRRRK